MTDPTAAVLSSFSSALADVVARTKPCDRLGAFSPFAGLGIRLETRPDRDSRRGVGRGRRGLGQACRRNGAAGQHRGSRSHNRHRAAAISTPRILRRPCFHPSFLISARCRSWLPPSTAFPLRRLVRYRWSAAAGAAFAAARSTPGSSSTCGCAQPRGGPRARCLRRSDRHGCPGGATRSCHSQRDDRPGRGKA